VPAPLVAVDGPFLLYRSFFALPDTIHGADGRSVNALLGAANVLLRVAADRDPRAIVACFGDESAAYRTELYPDYHAARPAVPEPLAWQFEQAPEFLAAFGWAIEYAQGLEADDLLGSLAAAEQRAGGRTLILTGDRDMYQCVDEHVAMLRLKATISGFEDIDVPAVHRAYGVPPALVPDFIALRGDPSDGLPGAPGIGPKTAADLLNRHGSLEAALAAADGERPKIAAALKDNAADLRAFREIATLRIVDIERPPDGPTDLRGGADAARRYGMNKLAERLEQAGAVTDL
jgi:DNA polymerase-1